MDQHLFNLSTAALTGVEAPVIVITPNLWLLSSEEIPPLLFTPEEAARFLRVGRHRVFDLIRQRELRSVKVGSSRRISAGRSATTSAGLEAGSRRECAAGRKANGEGSVYRRPNGRWAGQCYVTLTDGRRVRRAVYGKTVREVERKFSELLRGRGGRSPLTPADLTLESYLREWLTQIVAQTGPAEHAERRTGSRRNVTSSRIWGGSKLASLVGPRPAAVPRLAPAARSRGSRTIGYVHATLRAALEDAVREELIDRNVAKLVRVPAPAEGRARAADRRRGPDAPEGDTRSPALRVVRGVGAAGPASQRGSRPEWEDVDLEAGSLQIRRGLQRMDGQPGDDCRPRPPGRGAPSRCPACREALARAPGRGRRRSGGAGREVAGLGFVFTTPIGTPIDPRNCTRVGAGRRWSRPGVRVVRLHDFRHGCVSVLLGTGGAAADGDGDRRSLDASR